MRQPQGCIPTALASWHAPTWVVPAAAARGATGWGVGDLVRAVVGCIIEYAPLMAAPWLIFVQRQAEAVLAG